MSEKSIVTRFGINFNIEGKTALFNNNEGWVFNGNFYPRELDMIANIGRLIIDNNKLIKKETK